MGKQNTQYKLSQKFLYLFHIYLCFLSLKYYEYSYKLFTKKI